MCMREIILEIKMDSHADRTCANWYRVHEDDEEHDDYAAPAVFLSKHRIVKQGRDSVSQIWVVPVMYCIQSA
jgi:hypothetical protein